MSVVNGTFGPEEGWRNSAILNSPVLGVGRFPVLLKVRVSFPVAAVPATMGEVRPVTERPVLTETLPAVAVMVMGIPRISTGRVLLSWAAEPLGEVSLTTTMMW